MSDDTLPAEDNIVNDAATINSQDSPSGKADQAVSDDKTVASAPADEADEDDDDEEEEEEAETIPITADTVPASHPDAGKLEEALPEDSQPIIAKAAEDAGLGTSVGAGLAELVQAQDEGDQADEDEQSEAQREEQREESGTQESTTTPTTDAQPLNVEQQAETSASTSSSDASTSSSKVYSLLGKNLKLNSAEDAQPYCDELEAIEGLEEVHLGGNTLGQGACEAFARALQRSRSTLRVFNGADIFTGRLITEIPASLRALCNGLIEHEKLQVVDLSDNAFGGRCADAMTRLFSENHAIEVIRLQNNGLGISGGKIIAAALEAAADRLQAAGRSSALRIVTIGRNRLENGSAPDLARALARHGSAIEEVRVPQNGIRMQGIEELCRQLAAHCPNLRSLDVQDNTLVQRGSRALAAAIPAWPHLESLNLSDSLVRSTGARWIFDALGKHATGLKTLLLQYCELNRDAIVALADVLESSLHSLKHVELHGNWIEEDDEAVERIKAAIQSAGGDVDELGLDELEPEAEEEEEAEEDYEDFDEEEEEEEEAAPQREDQEHVKPPVPEPEIAASRATDDETKLDAPPSHSDTDQARSPIETNKDRPASATESSAPASGDVLDADASSSDGAVGALGTSLGALALQDSGHKEAADGLDHDAGGRSVEATGASVAQEDSAAAAVPSASTKIYSLLGKNLKLNSAEDAQPYCDELEAIEGLEEVHLGGNTLGQGACEAFARALQRSRSTLRVFNGADIFTGRLITEIPASLRALCNGLIEHEKLQVVDLSDNAFGGRCADAMTRLFSENHAIEVIRLQNNGLGISGGKIIAAALEAAADRLQAAGRSSALRIVTIGRNRLENGSAPDLARALARHGSAIEEVRVPQNGIRMQGIEELCRQLAAHCPNLRSLDVQDNTLVQRGSRALAAAIPAWPHLESLNLSDSLVRSTGARWIFDALGKHATGLKTLLLQYCELNRDAIVALADVLESSLHSLKHVELHGNWIEEDDEAVERIKAAIQSAGGDVDELGLDELEPEAEEEEEAEEDYEDFDEEEEEAALEEEEQEEAQVPAVTPSTVAFDPSAESNATVAEQPGKAVIQETSVADDASEKEGKEVLQQAADSTTDAIGALESAVGAITLQDGAEGVSDRDVAGAVAEDIQADKIEDSQDLSSNARGEVALDSTPSAEVQTALSNGEAMEDVQADVKPEGDEKSLAATGSVAAADDDKDVVEGSVPEAANAATSDSILAPQSEEPDDRAGLDAAAGAVAAIPTGVLDTTANLASASGDVIKDTVEDKVDDVSPLLTKGPPVDEAATAAGAPFQDLSTDAADHDKGAAETAAAKLNSALESAKATVPDALGREEQPAVSGQAISLGDADDVVQPDAVTAGADTGAPSQDADHKGEAGSKRTSILDSIESAADSVFPAPSGLVSSSEHGGISGEESGTSALPTPALERDLMAESAGESKATQEAIPLQGEDVAAPKIEARRGFILESIKSASQSVIPAASNLLGQRGHGGVSGEGLDTSALPTPAVERDLVDGAVAPEGGVEAEHAEQDQRRAPGASILDTIKSATQAVLPAAAGSSLIAGGARSGHGAVSGEGLDTSALPTPAAERDLVEAGPSTSAGPSTTSSAAPPPPSSYEVGDKDKEAARPGTATGRASTGRKLPSSESQMIRQIAEALSDELPQARQRRQGHGRINSIDLSGELYIDGAMSPSRFAHLERDEDDDEAARAGGRGGVAGRMRAALGAVWELMR